MGKPKMPVRTDEPAAVWVPRSALHAWAENPRKNDGEPVKKVMESIKRFGFAAPIVARTNGEVIAGHTRLKAAEALGLDRVPVRYMDLDPAEAHLLALADNKLNEEAEWDASMVASILSDFSLDDAALAGWDSDDLEKLANELGANAPREVEEDEVPEPPAVAVTKPGDLWILGEHRLLCGDSTKAEDIARVVRGESVNLQIVDPPFDKDYSAWPLLDPQVVMVWGRGDEAMRWEASTLIQAGYGFHELVFTGGVRGWPCDWFPCTVHDVVRMWRNDKAIKGFDAKALRESGCRTIEDGTRPFSVQEHAGGVLTGYGGMSWGKALVAMRMAMAYIAEAGTVFDPCAGSGTSLIAAHMHGRLWRGVEMQPQWADLIVKRWEEATGEKAELAT